MKHEPSDNGNLQRVKGHHGKRGWDGSVAVQFGGSDGKIQNCLPIMTGWGLPRALISSVCRRDPEWQMNFPAYPTLDLRMCHEFSAEYG